MTARSARILVLPGIGDIYWVMVALKSFCGREGITEPIIDVWDFDGRRRSMGYVERIPFVRAGAYFSRDNNAPEFRESYFDDGRTVFDNTFDHDFYIAVNGPLRHGRSIAQAMPGYALDFFFELRRPPAEESAAARYAERWPDGYIVAHLSDFGMFAHWVKRWDAQSCARLIVETQLATRLPVVLTGGTWDRGFSAQVARIARCEDLSGQTSLDEFFALFRHARGCIGWPGGNTILATTFRVPTVIVWSSYFPLRGFYQHACPPEALGKWYKTATVEDDQPKDVARQLARIMERAHA